MQIAVGVAQLVCGTAFVAAAIYTIKYGVNSKKARIAGAIGIALALPLTFLT